MPQKMPTKKWLAALVAHHSPLQKIGNLNYQFCTDEYLLALNKKYLKHKTLTDIITFDLHEKEDQISGDLFISLERVRDNALTYHVPEMEELRRVMAHGLLHLLGYGDKTKIEEFQMRHLEEEALQIWRDRQKT